MNDYPISKGQIKALRTIASKLGLSEEDYSDLLAGMGKKSTKGLTYDEAHELITRLSLRLNGHKQFEKKTKYKGQGVRGGVKGKISLHLTQDQAERIAVLEGLLRWDGMKTRAFIQRQSGKMTSVEMLSGDEATKVIVGMTKILANGDWVLYGDLNRLSNSALKSYKPTFTGKRNA
jgi:hypothetical protein